MSGRRVTASRSAARWMSSPWTFRAHSRLTKNRFVSAFISNYLGFDRPSPPQRRDRGYDTPMAPSIILCLAVVIMSAFRAAAAVPIFPAPRESAPAAGDFILDHATVIAIPAAPSPEELFLARMLADELADRFELHLKIERLNHLAPAGNQIAMGAF